MRPHHWGLALLLAAALALQAAEASQESVPMYGNWCGPMYGSGTPIDAIDACCQAHDKCYDASGYFNCACDQQIVGCLQKVSLPKWDSLVSESDEFEEQRVFRAAAVLYFRSTLCRDNGAWAWAPRLAALGRRMLRRRAAL